MSSVWTPIDEKTLSTNLIKNEHAVVDDEDNSSLSNVSDTTSSTNQSRLSPKNSSQTNEPSTQQQGNSTNNYSQSPTATTVNNLNTVSSNDLQQEQYPSTNGKKSNIEFRFSSFFLFESKNHLRLLVNFNSKLIQIRLDITAKI